MEIADFREEYYKYSQKSDAAKNSETNNKSAATNSTKPEDKEVNIFSNIEKLNNFINEKYTNEEIEAAIMKTEDILQLEFKDGQFIEKEIDAEDNKDTKNKLPLIGILNDLLKNEKIKAAIDKNGDKKIDDKEVKEFLEAIDKLDGKKDYLSIKDIILGGKELNKTNNKDKTDTKSQDKKTTPKNNASKSTAPKAGGSGGAGGAGGIGGGGGGNPVNSGTAAKKSSSTSAQTPNNASKIDELKEQRANAQKDVETVQKSINEQENNVKKANDEFAKTKEKDEKNTNDAKQDYDKKEQAYRDAVESSKTLTQEEKDKLNEYLDKINQAEEKTAKANTELTEATEKETAANQKVTECQNNVTTAQSEVTAQEGVVAGLESALSSYSNISDADSDTKADYEKTQAALQEAKASLEQKKSALEAAKKALQEAQEEQNQAKNSVETAKTNYENAKQELENLNKERENKESEIKQLEEKLEKEKENVTKDFHDSKEKLDKAKDTQNEDIIKSEKNISEAQKALEKEQSKLQTEQAEVDAIDKKINELENEEKYKQDLSKNAEALYEKMGLSEQGLDLDTFKLAMEGYNSGKLPTKGNGYVGIVDEKNQMYYLVNVNTGEFVSKSTVSTGAKTLTDVNSIDQEGTHNTPAGWLEVGDEYYSGKSTWDQGMGIQLHGLENCNDNTFNRGVVCHSASYGPEGETWGCLGFQTDFNQIKELCPTGALIFVSKEDSNYREQSEIYTN